MAPQGHRYEVRTSKAVGYPHILSIVLTKKHAHNSPRLCLALNGSVVVIDGTQKDEGCDGDVSGDEGKGFCRGGRHRGVF